MFPDLSHLIVSPLPVSLLINGILRVENYIPIIVWPEQRGALTRGAELWKEHCIRNQKTWVLVPFLLLSGCTVLGKSIDV